MDALTKYNWPGNVRELENEIERALVLSSGEGGISLDKLSEKIRGNGETSRSWRRERKLKAVLAEVEKEMILEALEKCAGNRTHTSDHLGVSRATLLAKLKEYGLQ